MKSYKDLNIYLEAHQLAVEIHRLSLQLPKFELFEEGSQIPRSSKAVSTAIVEGYGRKRYKAEFIRFLTYAHTECDETIEHLNYLFETLREKYTGLSKQINKFIDWVDKNWNNYPSAE